MSGKTLCCISCGSELVQCVGDIPAANTFAGRVLHTPLNGGYLYQCLTCFMSFRYPQISKKKLDELYREGDGVNWQHSHGARKDWEIAVQWVNESFPGGSRILDVGCFDGGFLNELGYASGCYGIEIHKTASDRAKQQGIDIIGHDFDVLETIDCFFDVVVAFDVIEHVVNPRDFLKLLAAVVRPGGMVIIATGNTLAPSWRFMGSRYWYCTNAEHISFINPIWCKFAASSCGLEVQQIQRFSHVENLSLGIVYKIKEILKNIFYRCAPWASVRLRMIGAGKRRVDEHPELACYPPSWISAKDHFIARFRKT